MKRYTPKDRADYWRRIALGREATKIIKSADRRRARELDGPKPKRPTPEPLQTRNGWIRGLGNLRRVMRARNSRNYSARDGHPAQHWRKS